HGYVGARLPQSVQVAVLLRHQGQLAIGRRFLGDDNGEDRLWFQETSGLKVNPASRFIADSQFDVLNPVGRPHWVQDFSHRNFDTERLTSLDRTWERDDRGMTFLQR